MTDPSINEAGTNTGYARTSQPQPNAPAAISGVGSFGYDADGNRAADPTYSSFTYDDENRVTSLGSGPALTNAYDGDGTRVVRVSGGVTTHYIGGACGYNLSTSHFSIYYQFGGQTVAMKQGSTVSYLHHDHLGSLVSVTDTSHVEQWSGRYAPYGALRLSSGTLPTGLDRLFTGQTRDLGNDSYCFFKSRYYDATIGRFHISDSIVPGAGNPQALNRYAYALNHPLRYRDPTGHLASTGDDGEYVPPPPPVVPVATPTPEVTPTPTPTASVMPQATAAVQPDQGPSLLTSLVHTWPTNMWLIPGNQVNDIIGNALGILGGGHRRTNFNGDTVYENVQGPTRWLVRDVLGNGSDNAVTMGHVILNSTSFNERGTNYLYGQQWMAHENMHVHQSAILGALYLPVYFAQAAVTKLLVHGTPTQQHDAMPMESQAIEAGFQFSCYGQ